MQNGKAKPFTPTGCVINMIRDQDVPPPPLTIEIPNTIPHPKEKKNGSRPDQNTIFLSEMMISKFMNEFMKSSFLPKFEPNIVRISAL